MFWWGILKESPRPRGEDNIRMDLKEIQSENVKWVHLVQDRDKWPAVVGKITSLWVL